MTSENGYAKRDAEIQRLRAAMVHAMDDAEWIAQQRDLRGDVRASARRAQKTLKAALETP